MKLAPLLLLLLPALAFGTEGRIFLTSKGGTVQPLASVAIRAFDAADYRQCLARSGAAQKKYAKLGDRLATLLGEAGELAQSNLDADEKTELLERNTRETRKVSDEIAAFAFEFLATVPLKPAAATRSDADGRYRLRLADPAHTVVIAAANHTVADATEYSWWVIFDPPAELNLSPDNRMKAMPWDAPPPG